LPGKTVWDWPQLLIVPAVIAAGGYWFNHQQRKRGLEIANQRAQDDVLQAYLDQVTELLLKENVHELLSDDRIRELIHARTLHVLERLDLEQLDEKHKGVCVSEHSWSCKPAFNGIRSRFHRRFIGDL
jgi:hypothetical protein